MAGFCGPAIYVSLTKERSGFFSLFALFFRTGAFFEELFGRNFGFGGSFFFGRAIGENVFALRLTLGFLEHREVVESDGVEEALLQVAESYVQLLTPTRDDSPVAKYLEKRGEGIHHIGYRVDDCGAAQNRRRCR